jgi:glycosyltransferase involved in cell wall biosynthesis
MDIKISVVIPTYKRPALLVKCVQALCEQTFDKHEYEIIVVSDGPDTETEKALKKCSQQLWPAIRYVPLPKKKGPAAARNLGWKQARAGFIAFTDDDCLPDPFWLSSLWQAWSRMDKPSMVAFAGKITVPLPSHPTDYERNTANLETAEFVTANCACTKQALIGVRGFDEAFRMAWREDSDLHFKLIQHDIPLHHVNEAIVIHPVRQAPWGVSIREQKKSMFNALLYKKYPHLYRKKIQPQPPWLYYGIVTAFLLSLAGLLLGSHDLATASLVVWSVLTTWFIFKRLLTTSRSLRHLLEMIVTSMVIPFLSVFWRLYGSWKYKTLLI